MQSADNVKLGNRLGISRCSSFKRFFKRHGVRARRIFFASEGTQTASRYADVGGINVAVDVEVRPVRVHAFPHMIGQPTDSEDVTGAIQGECIVKIKPLMRHDLFRDRLKTWVVCLKWMGHPNSMITQDRVQVTGARSAWPKHGRGRPRLHRQLCTGEGARATSTALRGGDARAYIGPQSILPANCSAFSRRSDANGRSRFLER